MTTQTYQTTAVPLLGPADIELALAAGARIEFTAWGCDYDLPPYREPGSGGWVPAERESVARYEILRTRSNHGRLRAFYPTQRTRIARLKARMLAMLGVR